MLGYSEGQPQQIRPRAPMGHMGQSQAEGEGDLSFSHLRNGLLAASLVLGVKRIVANVWGDQGGGNLAPKALLSSQMSCTKASPTQLEPTLQNLKPKLPNSSQFPWDMWEAHSQL